MDSSCDCPSMAGRSVGLGKAEWRSLRIQQPGNYPHGPRLDSIRYLSSQFQRQLHGFFNVGNLEIDKPQRCRGKPRRRAIIKSARIPPFQGQVRVAEHMNRV